MANIDLNALYPDLDPNTLKGLIDQAQKMLYNFDPRSDVNAEADPGGDKIAEDVNYDEKLQPFFQSHAADPTDPWTAIRSLYGDEVAQQLAAKYGLTGVDFLNPELEKYSKQIGQALQKELVGYGKTVDVNKAITALEAHRVPDTTALLNKPSGLVFQDHMLAAHQAILGARQSIEVAEYQFEHPQLIQALLGRLNEVEIQAHSTRMFTPIGKLSQRVLETKLKKNYSVSEKSSDGQWQMMDHVKFLGVDLNDPLRATIITGSANWTKGAQGSLINKFQQFRMSNPGNLEISFILNREALGIPELEARVLKAKQREAKFKTQSAAQEYRDLSRELRERETLFNRMLDEAKGVMPWVKGSAFDATSKPTQLPDTNKYLLSNKQLREKYVDLLQKAGAAKGTVRIMSDSIDPMKQVGDKTMLSSVFDALRQGAKVEILVGRTQHKDSLESIEALKQFKQQVSDHLGAAALDRLTVLERPGVVHTKAMFIQVGDQSEGLVMSMRAGQGMWNWETGSNYQGQDQKYRDLGVYLSSEFYRPLNQMLGERGVVNRIFATANTLGVQVGLPGRVTDASRVKDIQDEIAKAMTARRAGAAAIRKTDTGLNLAFGGAIRLGNQIVYAGDLFKFSVLETTFGPETQYYIPELSKFVGAVIGVGDQATEGKTFERHDVIAAISDAIQGNLEQNLKRLAQYHGASYVQNLLFDPVMRARLRFSTREYGKSRFENFIGAEMGYPSFDAKTHARLVWGMQDGRLDMRETLPIRAIDWENVLSQYAKNIRRVLPRQLLGLRQVFNDTPIVMMAGGFSRFKTVREERMGTPMRAYDLNKLVDSLNVAGRLEDGSYMFFLPASKAAQLPQRSQNLAGARDLGVDFIDDSLGLTRVVPLQAPDQDLPRRRTNPRRGMIFRGYMATGMGGNNSYYIAEEFVHPVTGEPLKFNSPWQNTTKLDSTLVIGSENKLRETVQDLIKKSQATGEVLAYYTDEKGNAVADPKGVKGLQVRLTEKGILELNHRLPIGDIGVGVGGSYLARFKKGPTEDWKWAKPELVIDLSRNYLTYDSTTHRYVMGHQAQLLRMLQSQDRMILGAKAPGAFIQRQSGIFQDLDARMQALDPTVYAKMGLGRANIITSTDNIKTGDFILQTGLLGVIENDLFEYLLKNHKGFNKNFKLGDSLDKFADKFNKYLTDDARQAIRELQQNNLSGGELEKLFRDTKKFLNQHQYIRATDTKHIASSFLAFTLLAEHLGAQMGVDVPGADALDILGFMPMVGVSTLSASAITMSSRNRVNFLSYHSGEYADSLAALMAASPEYQKRNLAIRELVGTGVLGLGNWDFKHNKATGNVLIAGQDFDVTALALPGLETPLASISKLLDQLKTGKGDTEKVKEKIDEHIATIKRKLSDNTRPMGEIEGNFESARIQAVLRTQEKAGRGAMTVLIPELGNYVDGRWVYDGNGKIQRGFRAVQFMSPDALRALGSFEDYSHDIQRAQVEIASRMHILTHRGQMSAGYKQAYLELIDLAETLRLNQSAAMVTDLQKFIGGRLAIQGQNMIAGHLPHLEAGVMVVGDAAYTKLRDQVRNELVRAFDEIATTKGSKDLYDLIKKQNDGRIAPGTLQTMLDTLLGDLNLKPETKQAVEAFKKLSHVQYSSSGQAEQTNRTVQFKSGRTATVADSEHGLAFTKTRGGLRYSTRPGQANVKKLSDELARIRGELSGIDLKQVQAEYDTNIQPNLRGLESDVVLAERNLSVAHGEVNQLNRVLQSIQDGTVATEVSKLRVDTQNRLTKDIPRWETELKGTTDTQRIQELEAKIQRARATIDSNDRTAKILQESADSIKNRQYEAEYRVMVREQELAGQRAVLDQYKSKPLVQKVQEILDKASRVDDLEKRIKNLEWTNLDKVIQAQTRAEALVKNQALGGLMGLFDTLIDDPMFRDKYMRAIFQRAGAPMGPLGMVVQKIMRVGEYNQNQKHIQLDTKYGFSNMSMWVSTGTMMFNLGDYDGDTASVALFGEYARLKSLNTFGVLREDSKLAEKYARAEKSLRYSAKELEIAHARFYTGENVLLSERHLYLMDKAPGMSLSDRIEQIHDLYQEKLNLDLARQLHGSQTSVWSDLMQQKGWTQDQVDLISEFQDRLDKAHKQAQSLSAFTTDVQGVQVKVGDYVRQQLDTGKAKTVQEATEQYFRSGANRSEVMGYIKKLTETISDATIENNAKVLQAVFSATAFASTTLIGQGFESIFTHQMVTEAQYQQDLAKLEAAGATPDELGQLQSRRHRQLGSYLALQQIARNAIKPKVAGKFLEEIARRVNGPDDFAAGIDYMSESDSAKTLDIIYELMNGESLFGTAKDPVKTVERYERSVQTVKRALLELYASGVDDKSKYDENGRLQKRDYGFGRTIDALYAETGGNRDLIIDRLVEGFDDAVAGRPRAHMRAELEAWFKARPGEEAWLNEIAQDPNMTPEDAQKAAKVAADKLALGKYLEKLAETRAYEIVDDFSDPFIKTQREAQKMYQQAINGTSMRTRAAVSAEYDLQDKLRMFENLSDRGKVTNAEGQYWALTDIFSEVDTMQLDGESKQDTIRRARAQLEATVKSVTNTPDRAETMGALFEAWATTGDTKSAIETVAKQRQNALFDEAVKTMADAGIELEHKEAVIRDFLKNHEQTLDQIADTDQRQKALEQAKKLKTRMEAYDSAKEYERELGRIMGYEFGKAQRGATTPETLDSFLTSARGQSVQKHVGNWAIPGIVSAFMMMGAGATSAEASDIQAESVAGALGFAATSSNPAAMVAATAKSSSNRRESALRLGIMGLSVAAGTAVGYGVEAAANKMGLFGPKRGMATTIASGAVGTIAGMAVGWFAEALAIKAGWLPSRKPQGTSDYGHSVTASDENLQAAHADELDETVGLVEVHVVDDNGQSLGIYDFELANEDSEEGLDIGGDDSISLNTLDEMLSEDIPVF